jgi:NADH-quinone oxidoreductase subunit J
MYIIETLGALSILSSIKVISARNPVHSILALVVVFVIGSIYLITIGLDLFGLMLIIVYVGAIAILFLFVIMMLNIKHIELLENSTNYLPFSFLFLIALWYSIISSDSGSDLLEIEQGRLLSIQYSLFAVEIQYLFIAGWILFLAMIGAILLTCYHEDIVKRQDIFTQTWA